MTPWRYDHTFCHTVERLNDNRTFYLLRPRKIKSGLIQLTLAIQRDVTVARDATTAVVDALGTDERLGRNAKDDFDRSGDRISRPKQPERRIDAPTGTQCVADDA